MCATIETYRTKYGTVTIVMGFLRPASFSAVTTLVNCQLDKFQSSKEGSKMSEMNPKSLEAPIPSEPCIMAERTSGTLAQLYFNPVQVNPDPELYRAALDDLYTRTSGAIIVDLDFISSGWITVCQNPVRKKDPGLMDTALNVISGLLKQVNTKDVVPVETNF